MTGKIIYNLKRKRCDHTARNTIERDNSDDGEHELTGKSAKLDGDESVSSTTAHRNERPPSRTSRDADNFLREALRKIQELEHELAMLDEEDYDSGHEDNPDDELDEGIDETHMLHAESEALGFAVCVKETMNFLATEGLRADNPLVLALRDRLIGKCDSIPI